MSSLNPAGVAENADAIVMAKLLAGALVLLVSLQAAMAALAVTSATIRFILTIQILFGVRKQDTQEKIDPDVTTGCLPPEAIRQVAF